MRAAQYLDRKPRQYRSGVPTSQGVLKPFNVKRLKSRPADTRTDHRRYIRLGTRLEKEEI